MNDEPDDTEASSDEAIFNAAVDLPAMERPAYLERACAKDSALRQRVEALLRSSEDAPGFLPDKPDTAITEGIGEHLGRYKLLKIIGEGGWGVVYLAEQELPVRRRVALKIIKLGMDTKAVIARFEAERQALAMMDHPSIAKVLDAGATKEGRPFFVMELVDGVPITTFCAQNPLSPQQLIELFIRVCQAIQHAHQKGIIHRDIKPSNILVTFVDGKPAPKVIDFGIAKAIDPSWTEGQLFTGVGQLIGTPVYMSPEQVEPIGQRDIDTRSDIYALGVLLYELLTGKTPFDAKELLAAGLDEMRRTIREVEPARPSTRLTQETFAADVSRRTSPEPIGQEILNDSLRRQQLRELIPVLRGDLDWIVMKCLEKDRARRYDTATALAADLQRHLDSEPVTARPPSNLYRLQKMVGRNKLVFAAGAAVLVALVAGLAASLWQARRGDANARAETRERIRAEKYSEDLVRQQKLTDEAWSVQATQAAELFLAADDAPTAIAYLAQGLRRTPDSTAIGERILSAFLHSNFPQLLAETLPHAAEVRSARFSRDGTRLVTCSYDQTARVWDAQTGKPVTPPLECKGWVRTAEFSPDGALVATASWQDTCARIWDARTGKMLHRLGQGLGVWCAHFSLDGTKLVTAASDKEAVVWDVKTGRALRRFRGHGNWVVTAVFSPDGQHVASGDSNGTALIWDANTGQLTASPLRHGYLIQPDSIRFSPDGNYVATASANGTAIVWDAHTGHMRTGPLRHGDLINAAEFSPDGQFLATASHDKTARIWDITTGQPVTPPLRHKSNLEQIRWSPEGTRVVTASWDYTARVWDARTGQPLTEPMRHHGNIWSAEFSPDGQRVATGCGGRVARIWDVRTTPSAVPLAHDQPVQLAEYTSDGLRLLTAAGATVRVWDARQPLHLIGKPLRVENTIKSAHFFPEGTRFLTAAGRSVRIWDATNAQALTEPIVHKFEVKTAELSRDGRSVVTVAGNTVQVWDCGTSEPVGKPFSKKSGANFAEVLFARFGPDGQVVLIGCNDGTVILWDVPSGQPLFTPPIKHEGDITFAEFSPDGQRFVTASSDNIARVWDVHTGEPLTAPMDHGHWAKAARFSPDGKKLVTVVGNQSLVWDAFTGQPVSQPMTHEDRVTSAFFSPDGNKVVTASDDQTARVWDAATGQPVGAPLRHLGKVRLARFSPDGSHILTASEDKTARLWELPIAPQPIPRWFACWAEVTAGRRLSDRGLPETPSKAELAALKQPLTDPDSTDYYSRFTAWYLSRDNNRPFSPGSSMTVADYIASRIEQNTVESLREALQLSPTNATAFARLALALLVEKPSSTSRQMAEADWSSRHALELSPENAEARSARAAVNERQPSQKPGVHLP